MLAVDLVAGFEIHWPVLILRGSKLRSVSPYRDVSTVR